MTRGLFITLEGPEGSGKSTHARLLKDRLESCGKSVLLTREPGGTPLGEAVRGILQHNLANEPPVDRAEVMLFLASRAQLCERVIRPALESGTWVICDRFTDSTLAYQGYGRGFDVAILRALNAFATHDLVPDLTLLLDIPPETGFSRVNSRGLATDRIEAAGADFHRRLRDGFLQLAKDEPDRFAVVDSNDTRENVAARIWQIVQPRHLKELTMKYPKISLKKSKNKISTPPQSCDRAIKLAEFVEQNMGQTVTACCIREATGMDYGAKLKTVLKEVGISIFTSKDYPCLPSGQFLLLPLDEVPSFPCPPMPMIKNPLNSFRLLSLFSGAGGLDIGFEKAGFKTAWANEYDNTIAPSYTQYFPNVVFDGRSIVDVPDSDLPVDILGVIGGPPCQSWSEAGARRGINDHRGQLFFEYLRVIRKTQPKFFVAENVHGMIHSRNEKTFQHIISLFEKEGYAISWKLLKASDYGVPQDRERVFIVGYHRSLGRPFEFPKPLGKKFTLREAIYDLAKVPIGKRKGNIMNHELTESGYSPIFLSRNRVRGWDEQSFTILATDRHIPFHPQAPKMPRKQDGGRMLAPGHEHAYRRLTVRECARIQTFPDDYEFVYTNIRHGYKMIGNAVPVNLAYAVAKKIAEDLL